MQSRPAKLLLITIATALCASCDALSYTVTPVAAEDPSVTTLFNGQVTGPLVSVYATYSTSAPADRIYRTFFPGVRMIADSRVHQRLTMVAAKPSLSYALLVLKRLSWISSVEVDSTVAYLASDTVP